MPRGNFQIRGDLVQQFMLSTKFGAAAISSTVLRSAFRRLATTTNANPANISQAAHASIGDIPVSAEVHSLLDRICSLDLIQTSQLVTLLKKRLNLPEVVAAPMAAMHTPSSTSTTATPTTPVVEKTEFRITLEKFDPASKAKVIKEVKALLPQLNLVEAKTFVESAPKMLKDKVKKEEAEKIKKTMEELGAVITLD